MKAALIIYGALETVSGGYLYDRMLVQHLRSRGHDVEIVSLPWRNYAAHLADNLSASWLRRLRSLNVDVIVQDELNHPSLAWVNRRLNAASRPPIVSIVHHLRSSESHPLSVAGFYRWVERHYLASVDGFVYNSKTTQQAVAALAPCAMPGVVAFPAADHLKPGDESSSWLREAIVSRTSSHGPLRVCFVGNVIARKELHTLVDGLRRLLTASWTLDVVGSLTVDAGYAGKVQRTLAMHGLEANVRWHGRLTDEELVQVVSKCHVLAVPSFEGYGIVYLEAMRLGLPVIASTAGAAHEIVNHGVDGFLAPPGDADALADHLSLLQRDRSLLCKMSLAARQRYERQPTWSQSCAQIEEFLAQIVARRAYTSANNDMGKQSNDQLGIDQQRQ